MASCSGNAISESPHCSPTVLLCQSSLSLPPPRPSSAPVSSQPLSFSISRILGLEDNTSQPHSDSLIPENDNLIPNQHQENGTKREQKNSDSPNIDSDNPSTDVDSGRESDTGRTSPNAAERPRKVKQRTTFSPIEVCELEQVFSKRPYLLSEDEDELVQKLGLTRRNVRFWFQNRRAKLRRQEKTAASLHYASLQKQFYQLPPAPAREFQFGSPLQLMHAHFQRPPLFPNHAEYSPYTPCPCCPNTSNQFSAADVHSPSHRDYLKYLSYPFSEPSAFERTFPSVHAVPWHNAMVDEHKKSRDYQTRWVAEIKEREQHKD